jgi:hypothetical protein
MTKMCYRNRSKGSLDVRPIDASPSRSLALHERLIKLFKPIYLLTVAMLVLSSSIDLTYAADKQIKFKQTIKPEDKLEKPQQILNALKPIEVNTQMLELHAIGKNKEVNTAILELHGFPSTPKEVNTTGLELHGKSASSIKEVTTSTLELHGFSKVIKEVNVLGLLELHGRVQGKETSIASKRLGMAPPPTMQGTMVQNNAINTLPNNQPIDPHVIKKSSAPESKAVVGQSAIIGVQNTVIIDNKLPDIKPTIAAPTVTQGSLPTPSNPIARPTLINIKPLPSIPAPTATAFDKVAYKRDADRKLGNLWLGKCGNTDCKRDMQKVIDMRIAEVTGNADKAIDLRNPVLLNNLENQMDAKYNPQMQQVLDKNIPVIRGMPKPIKINPNNLKL